MTTIVDIYCRVSTDPQEDNTSLDEQESISRIYCQDHGLIVGQVYREVWSGYQYREREKLNTVRERYREGKIQGVVIRTLDRLSRSQTHVAILMEEMEHYNVTLYSVKEVIDDTAMGKFARMMLAFVAEMEREKIMDRMVSGKMSKARAGKVVSGTKALYGWKWALNENGERDHPELDEDQAKVLREAGQEYADGVSLQRILKRLEAEGVPGPGGKRWYPRTLRHILTDPRMTGKNVKLFTNHKKAAKQHLEEVDLPDGTYPRILSDELYEKILARAAINAAQATRNSKYPEMFLLRAGFARCPYCKQTMMAKRVMSHGNEWFAYSCPNRFGKCRRFYVSALKVDAAVWATLEQVADHAALIEKSVHLAIQNRPLDEDIRATEAALDEWKAKVENYEGDLEDSSLRGATRAGIRHLLDVANGMAEDLQAQLALLLSHAINHDKVRAAYETVLAWCKQVKSERQELTYTQKRDFLYMLGATVLIWPQERRDAEPTWDIRVALPAVQEIIYQKAGGALENSLSTDRSGPASLPHSSSRTRSRSRP